MKGSKLLPAVRYDLINQTHDASGELAHVHDEKEKIFCVKREREKRFL